MPGLVLEGGTMRPIFSAGAMDCLLDHHIMFPYCIGVSAGISNGVSYISQQKGRNLEILRQYRNDPRYYGKRNLLRDRSMFGVCFIFEKIPNVLVPFDHRTFRAFNGKVLAGITCAETVEVEFVDCRDDDEHHSILKATCAIPVIFPGVRWNGRIYYDGGLADSIPLKKSIIDGNTKNLVILTQPKGFVKTYNEKYDRAISLIGRKYPLMPDVLRNRHLVYNQSVALCEEQEILGNAVILRPEYPINSLESDFSQLEKAYHHGYDLCNAQIESIKNLFAE